MLTSSSGEMVCNLPAEIWCSALIYAKEPNAALVCQLFRNLLADQKNLLDMMSDELNRRGIDHIVRGIDKSDAKLDKVKECLISRLITLASNEFIVKLKTAPKDSVFTFMHTFRMEEAIALVHLFDCIAPQIQGVLDTDLAHFQERLPKAPLHRALCIRTFFMENQEKLSQVEVLDLKGASLTLVPEEMNIFTGLIKVDLSDNKLTALTSSLGKQWVSLQECRLDYNPIIAVQTGFGAHWRNLREFCMTKAKVSSLPADFGCNWTEIRSVNLNFNLLTEIPQNWGVKWGKVEQMAINDNKLAVVPADLYERWPNLKFIRIKNNPLDQEVLQAVLNGFTRLIGAF